MNEEVKLSLKDYIVELHTVSFTLAGDMKAWFFFGKKGEGKFQACSWKIKGMWAE